VGYPQAAAPQGRAASNTRDGDGHLGGRHPQQYPRTVTAILATSSGLPTKSVRVVIAEACTAIQKLVGKPLNIGFEVNHVTNREGEYVGYAYVYLQSTIIWNVLLGRRSMVTNARVMTSSLSTLLFPLPWTSSNLNVHARSRTMRPQR